MTFALFGVGVFKHHVELYTGDNTVLFSAGNSSFCFEPRKNGYSGFTRAVRAFLGRDSHIKLDLLSLPNRASTVSVSGLTYFGSTFFCILLGFVNPINDLLQRLGNKFFQIHSEYLVLCFVDTIDASRCNVFKVKTYTKAV